MPAAALGLSPRVRGNLPAPAPALCGVRSIPACAGEPVVSGRVPLPFWVYPRVCGGTRSSSELKGSREGLSPRVRGNPDRIVFDRLPERSIPACAGEPARGLTAQPASKVYPRVCGGTVFNIVCAVGDTGLSPRVRGNQHIHLREVRRRRSIPACAGEPGLALAAGAARKVYPRVCGGTAASPG